MCIAFNDFVNSMNLTATAGTLEVTHVTREIISDAWVGVYV